jgi:transposase-like protein
MEQKFQRWTSKRKAEIVLQLIKGEVKLVDICRQNDLKQSEVEGWIEAFLRGGEKNLKTSLKEEIDQYERQIKEMRAKIGELVLELDARKKLQALLDQEETNS